MLPKVKNTSNGKLLQVIFNSLDKNHDGKIDVNELNNSMIMFYNPQSYSQDADSWSKLSRVNWAPVADIKSYLMSLRVSPKLIDNFLHKINVENNHNITFAQFLRAKNLSIRTEIDDMLKDIPRSRSASHSPNIQRNVSHVVNRQLSPNRISNRENISPSRVERVVVRSPVRREIRQQRNSGSRKVIASPVKHQHVIIQQSPVRSTFSPQKTSPIRAQIVRPVVPGLVVSPGSAMKQSPRSLVRGASPFKNKGKAKVVKAEVLQNPMSPPNFVNEQNQRRLSSPISPMGQGLVSHHGSLKKPSNQTFNISQSPTPKKDQYGSFLNNCFTNPCNQVQVPSYPHTHLKRSIDKHLSPVKKPLNNQVIQHRSPIQSQRVTTPTKQHINYNNPISQPIFPVSGRNHNRSPISPISPTLQRVKISGAPRYVKVVVGPKGGVTHSHLNNYQSPRKNGTIPTQYSNTKTTQGVPIRIRDNRTATGNTGDRTPSPNVQNRSVSPNQKTVVKGQYKTKEEEKQKRQQKDSNYSFGNNELKNFYDKEGVSANNTPNKKVVQGENTPTKPIPRQQVTLNTKEDLQKMLGQENSNETPKGQKNIAENRITYTPPKIPGVNSPETKAPTQQHINNETSKPQLKPQSNSQIIQNPNNVSVDKQKSIKPSPQKPKQQQQVRGKINPQDEVLVRGFDRTNIESTSVNNQQKQHVKPKTKDTVQIENQNPNQVVERKLPIKESPIKSNERKAPLTQNLSSLLALRIPLGFNSITAQQISKRLKQHFRFHASKKSFSRSRFEDFIKSFELDNQINDDEFKSYCDALFNGLDFDANGKLSRTEIGNFLILLSKGNKEDKIKAAFDLYDKNGDQKLDKMELTDYFLGVIKLSMIGKLSNSRQAQNIAASTAKKCFDQIDLNGDGSVGLNEFTEYILNGGDASASQNAMQEHQRQTIRLTKANQPRTTKMRNQRAQNIHDVKKIIDRIRQGVPLQNIHISTAIHYLKQDNPELYTIDKIKFKNFLKSLIKREKIKIKFSDGFDNIPSLFFKVFDVNNNGILDKQELGVGLFILCGKLLILVIF